MTEHCRAFDMSDAGEAWDHITKNGYDVIRDWGDEAYGHFLHTWDDGKRLLCRCRNCKGLFMFQKSEFHGFDGEDSYYRDYFPVESEEEAEKLTERFGGFEIERAFKGRYLMRTNGGVHWSRA